MSERDFTAGGREFKLSKIDPFKQFHIVRRLGPILGDIIPVAQKIKSTLSGTETEDQKFETIAQIAQPILNGLSKLSDEDANKVLLGLLSAVEVKQAPAGNWARIARDENLMIQDVDLPVLLQAAGRAFAFNLAGFFAIAPQISHGGK
jgi:hypothetical protein